jgi:hypothetical protein
VTGPRITIPNRTFLLFRGPLNDVGQWGAADLFPGHPRQLNSPNLMWPADRSWFVATEIDLPWTGIAGSPELMSDLLGDPALDTESTQPTAWPAYWRDGAHVD